MIALWIHPASGQLITAAFKNTEVELSSWASWVLHVLNRTRNFSGETPWAGREGDLWHISSNVSRDWSSVIGEPEWQEDVRPSENVLILRVLYSPRNLARWPVSCLGRSPLRSIFHLQIPLSVWRWWRCYLGAATKSVQSLFNKVSFLKTSELQSMTVNLCNSQWFPLTHTFYQT